MEQQEYEQALQELHLQLNELSDKTELAFSELLDELYMLEEQEENK